MTSYEMLKLSVWKTEDLTRRMEIRPKTGAILGALIAARTVPLLQNEYLRLDVITGIALRPSMKQKRRISGERCEPHASTF